ncbi:nucleoside-binding protein [Murinocardiopsis flavida]|uniref:Nucleoside-binding protein n=1 Tax=Murinocardiopsis flavida TaxID=645275 RepID=A0A2P8DH75_9ACTN|nr:BMP family ABC transporter substrate-binding protein [Murinocardiopsis flavida]PSK96529.1 nucleoside-binding protein [Murinocardiopsis flavida]
MKRNRTILTRFAAVAATGVLGLSMTACDNPSGDDGKKGGGEDSELRVGLAYDIGGRGDKSFNDSAYRGLERVKKELGVTDAKDLEPSEGESDADKVERLKLMAEEGYGVVIGVGYAYAEPMKEVAKDYPDVNFAVVDSEIEGADNITSLVFAEEQASFLAGASAALKTEEDHVGFIGGVNTPLIQKFEAGFIAGVEEIDPKIKIENTYLSQPPDMKGFQDPARGKEVALGQYDKGADVIYHAAGASGNGILEAAADQEKLFIGVDSDQYESAPEDRKKYVLTSAVKDVDKAVFEFVKSVQDGKAQAGIQRFDLASGGVSYTKSNKDEIGDVEKELDELQQKIIDGDIKVPTKPEK